MAERFDQEKNRDWNREPGIVIVPGSNYAREMEKFEQFPSRYGDQPGNPYRFRPFPRMVYRAENWKGKAVCMAAPPDPMEFPNPSDFQRAEEGARRFTERCQMIVNDEAELQKAMENGYRESPTEAVEYLEARRRDDFRAAAERTYEDRGLSEAAQVEARAAEAKHFDETGEQMRTVPEKPKRRRGRPPKHAA